ncbi:MAG: tRNA (5-methylaminomethyl-2-thiouridine)(34)-methyltransferase MnmD [Xanthomonadales bacterium]|jgi:tRNA 5-methylaminomethyl-2-thiouridine biosynthesis bifunctional protein|nr:tRNA (5-methylaminomethyl-2-thiouridine)(34)-methyltransferase MnmD [Xanthomonadales bacterium]
MRTRLTPPALTLGADGLLASLDYADRYGSVDGPDAQAEVVFLGGCRLPSDWAHRRHYRLLELGFGAATNFLATWAAWRADPQRPATLDYLAIEAHPLPAATLAAVHAERPHARAAARLAERLPPALGGIHDVSLEGGRVRLLLIYAEVTEALAELSEPVDAVYLDGFAPARNPAMWTPAVLAGVRRLLVRRGRLATYAATGALKRELAALGFEVQTRSGFGRKRECLAAQLIHQRPPGEPPTPPKQVHVVGAGIAGLAIAQSLRRAGLAVRVYEQAPRPANAASRHRAVLLHPPLGPEGDLDVALKQHALLAALRQLRALGLAPQPTGVLQRLPAEQAAAWAVGLPESWAQARADGLWLPMGGVLDAAALQAALIEHLSGLLHCGIRVSAADLNAWIAAGDAVVLASGADPLPGDIALPLRALRGQWARISAHDGPMSAVVDDGYLLPLPDGQAVIGSTHAIDDRDLMPRAADRERLLAKAERLGVVRPKLIAEGVGLRSVSIDRRPLIGPLPGPGWERQGWPAPRPGMYAALGLGSRGYSYAFLAADLLSARLTGRVPALPRRLLEAIDPRRFRRR